ncbi:hypothetical protein N7490_008119 [Penicillium lividum]|nr:hypothetical protein N7490_008119 [Penicillium lividum]
MAFPYTVASHLAYFDTPSAEFAARRPEIECFGVGGYIFSQDADLTGSESTSPPRILLLQRALTDSMPGLWEGPGGAHELKEDRTLLDGVVREVLEETGLHVSRFVELVGVDGWTHQQRDGRFIRIAKYSFIVEVYERRREVSGVSEVVPHEEISVVMEVGAHQAYKWAVEEEVKVSLETGVDKLTPHQGPNVLRAFNMLNRGLK